MRLLAVRPLVTILLATISLIGCTREVPSQASIRLSFSDGRAQGKSVGALGNTSISAIRIYITGGNSPIFYQWNGNHDENNPLQPPDPIVIPEVQTGVNLLVQVLTVISSDGNSGQVYYGSTAKNLTSNDPNVSVDVKVVSNSSAGDSQIAGRYLKADGISGPTGKIQVWYKPSSEPKMLVDNNDEIFGGWFRTFAIDGGALDYVVTDGTNLFGGAVGIGSLSPTNSRTVSIYTPTFYYTRGGDQGPRHLSSPAKSIYGFFGPGAVGQTVCYNSSSGPIPYAYTSATVGDTSIISWNSYTVDASKAYVILGGSPMTTSAGSLCSAGATRFLDFLSVDERQVTNHDRTLSFKGPFQIPYSSTGSSDALLATTSGSTLTVSWNYLPGVQSSTLTGSGIDGTDLFARVETAPINGNADFKNTDSDGIRCNSLVALGFSKIADVASNSDTALVVNTPPATAMTTPAISLASLPPTLATAIGAGNYTLIACPYANSPVKTYFKSAAVNYPQISQNGPGLQKLGLHLTGNTPQSSFYGAGLGTTPVTLLKAHFTNNTHQFVVMAGHTPLMPGDLSGATVEASVDGGTTYSAIAWTSASSGGMSAAVLPIRLSPTPEAPLKDLVNQDPTLDTNLIIRVTITNSVKSAYSLQSNVYTSPVITLLGSDSCSSPGSVEIVNVANSAVVTPDSIFTGLSTDTTNRYKMRWSGCPTAGAVFDYVDLPSSTSPSGCFSTADVQTDPMDEMGFIVSPTDNFGVSCAVTSSITLYTPAISLVASSYPFNISHSTATSGVSLLLSRGSGMVGTNNLVTDMLIAGASQSVQLLAAHVNSDFRFTDLNSPSGTATSGVWTVPSAASWTGSPSVGATLNLATATTPPGAPMGVLDVFSSGTHGKAFAMVTADNDKVLAVSENALDGGSPVMLINNASGLKVGYIPSQYGDFAGKNMVYFNMATASLTFAANPSFAKVFTWGDNSGNSYIFLAAGYGSGVSSVSKYLLGVTSGHGSSMTVTWGPYGSNPTGYNHDLKDIVVADLGSGNTAFVAEDWYTPSVQRWFSWQTLPTYSGSTWSYSAIQMGSGSQATSNFANGIIGLTMCGSEPWMVGRDGSDYFTAIPFNNSGLNFGAQLTDSTVTIPTQTRVSCTGLGSGFYQTRVFLTHDPASSAHNFHAFEAGVSPQCGGSPNQPLTLSGLSGGAITYSPTASTGIVNSLGGYFNYPLSTGFLLTYQDSANPTNIVHLAAVCGGGTVTLSDSTKKVVGSTPTGAPYYSGLQRINNSYMGNQSGSAFTLFGIGHQFYQLHMN